MRIGAHGFLAFRRHLLPAIASAACAVAFIASTAEGALLQASDAATIMQITGRPAVSEPINAAITASQAATSGTAQSPAQAQQIDLCPPGRTRSSRQAEAMACSKRHTGGDGLSVSNAETADNLAPISNARNSSAPPSSSTPNADVIANRLRTGDVQTSAVADSVGVGLRSPNPTSTTDAAPVVPR